MINYTTSSTQTDLEGIIDLQRRNLSANISTEEAQDQGFVTVVHRLEDLQKMQDIEPHVIAKDHENVVAYLLAMTARSRNDIPVLIPMFDTFDQVVYKNRPVSSYDYIVIGQACVDRSYRGQGVFIALYERYRRQFGTKYDFAITEIATRNKRSIRAHEKAGFEEVHRFTAPNGEEWSIVVWDW